MAKMIRLVSYKEEMIWRGTVLRMPSQWLYEESVDFMVFESMIEDRSIGLLVTSGYKAGLTAVLLPEESRSESLSAIKRDWLIENWAKWVYPEADVNDVYVTKYTAELPTKINE